MASIKLNHQFFSKLTQGLKDNEIAKKLNISTVQLWRVRLPDHDPRHNDPGVDFIAGLLKAFPSVKFEDVFFLDTPLRSRKEELSTGTDG
ncbi:MULTISPECIES: hypothetical protein [Moorella]|uniref:HTH cro/C1-type domain-containing protein n=1 Tax=Moorella mulderi DSM 14980 TaxID=1122241 RepID=A0A151AUJ3_9FIRM|nr:hypothetical protein [Moorella mulderi]KYH31344.1 hypothetical protein MOMUL_24150 [Moorella mulderi DSM 14980]